MSFAQSTAKLLGSTNYTQHDQRLISLRRQRSRKNSIGIDRLLSLAGLRDPASVYPPQTRERFIQLVGEVENSQSSDEYKSRAIFYLFLDFSQPKSFTLSTEKAPSTVAEYYASQIWMDASEQALVGALWYLDRNQVDKSLVLLGQPFDLYGCDTLNDYIVASLADQKPGAVIEYLAQTTKSIPDRFVDEIARALVLKGKFAEVLSLSRQQGNLQYLTAMTKGAIESKSNSLELVQQPFTAEEWNVVNDELVRIIGCASPTLNDVSATSELAYNILLVRALHTGNMEVLEELRKTSEIAELLVSKYAVYEGDVSKAKKPHSVLMYD